MDDQISENNVNVYKQRLERISLEVVAEAYSALFTIMKDNERKLRQYVRKLKNVRKSCLIGTTEIYSKALKRLDWIESVVFGRCLRSDDEFLLAFTGLCLYQIEDDSNDRIYQNVTELIDDILTEENKRSVEICEIFFDFAITRLNRQIEEESRW